MDEFATGQPAVAVSAVSAVTDAAGRRRRRGRRLLAALVGPLVLANGLALLLGATASRSGATDDLRAAQATLADQQVARERAERDLGQADDRLQASRDRARSAASQASRALSVADELLAVNTARNDLRRTQLEAISRGDYRQFNRLVAEQNANVDRSNPLLRQIRPLLSPSPSAT